MQLIVFYLVVFLSVSYGEFDLKKLSIEVLKQNESGECYQQYKNMDSYSLVKMKLGDHISVSVIDLTSNVKQNGILQVFDSSSNVRPEGILQGYYVHPGVFDECLSIADETKDFYGKYCLASIKLDEISSIHSSLKANNSFALIQNMKKKFTEIVRPNVPGIDIAPIISLLENFVNLGICIPNKCTNKDIQEDLPLILDDAKCYTKLTNNKMDMNAIIAIWIIGGFFVIAICSTAYDVFSKIRASKPIYQILVAFSIYTNGIKLFKISKNADQLGCLNGIKSISMIWVILGHFYVNMISFATIDNMMYINDWLDDLKSMFVLSATLSVDTFLTVGGLLTVYVFMKSKEMEMKESVKKIPLLYLHRYLRLTPALAIMVLAYGSGLIKYISDGPKWHALNTLVDDCAKNWWAALIYVQNYNQLSNMCIGQSWYLSVDFQLFILTPFLLIPLRKWPHLVIKSMSALVVIGMIIPFIIGYSYKLTGVGEGMGDPSFSNNYYFFTHARFSPYVIGMIFGYYIYNIKKRGSPLSLHSGYLLLLWTILIAGLHVCIFDGFKMVHTGDGNKWVDGLYLALNRSAWSLIVSLIILLCCTDNGGPINTFLSLPVFQIISKLSYSMYLVHYLVIIVVLASYRNALHFSNAIVFYEFYSICVLTIGISLLFSLIFESPMIVIEKVIFQKSDRKVEIIEELKEKV